MYMREEKESNVGLQEVKEAVLVYFVGSKGKLGSG